MFRVKNLLIHAIPSVRQVAVTQYVTKLTPTVCIAKSCCGPFWSNPGGPIPDSNPPDDPEITIITPCRFGITRPTECGLAHSTSPRVLVTEVVNPAELEMLKDELHKAVELADLVGEQMNEQLTPQSIEEIDQLERHLDEAQSELRDHRRRLER